MSEETVKQFRKSLNQAVKDIKRTTNVIKKAKGVKVRDIHYNGTGGVVVLVDGEGNKYINRIKQVNNKNELIEASRMMKRELKFKIYFEGGFISEKIAKEMLNYSNE